MSPFPFPFAAAAAASPRPKLNFVAYHCWLVVNTTATLENGHINSSKQIEESNGMKKKKRWAEELLPGR